MRPDLRLRLFLTYLDRLERRATGPLTVADVEQMRAADVPSNPLTRWVFGTRHPDVGVEDRTLPTTSGSGVGVRLYRPPAPDGERPPVVLLVHGGGWAVGNLDAYDAIASRVAADSRAVVASVDYRLAPDHPYPVGLTDVYDATVWVADHADDLGVDAGRLAVMGDSAGGNLAAVVCQRARDEGGPRIRHQTLLYPATDLTEREDLGALGTDAPVLSERLLRGFRDFYLGDTDPTDPRVSPLLADDLSNLPPALVITAEHDPLRGQGRAYARALAAAGVPTRATDYVGMIHGFLSFPGVARSAAQAFAEITQELTAHLATDPEAARRG